MAACTGVFDRNMADAALLLGIFVLVVRCYVSCYEARPLDYDDIAEGTWESTVVVGNFCCFFPGAIIVIVLVLVQLGNLPCALNLPVQTYYVTFFAAFIIAMFVLANMLWEIGRYSWDAYQMRRLARDLSSDVDKKKLIDLGALQLMSPAGKWFAFGIIAPPLMGNGMEYIPDLGTNAWMKNIEEKKRATYRRPEQNDAFWLAMREEQKESQEFVNRKPYYGESTQKKPRPAPHMPGKEWTDFSRKAFGPQMGEHRMLA